MTETDTDCAPAKPARDRIELLRRRFGIVSRRYGHLLDAPAEVAFALLPKSLDDPAIDAIVPVPACGVPNCRGKVTGWGLCWSHRRELGIGRRLTKHKRQG